MTAATDQAITVALSWTEARHAALVGAERRLRSSQDGRQAHAGANVAEDGWRMDIEGAGAELAFAKAMGWHWPGSVDVFHAEADVRHIHVRQSSGPGRKLLLRPNDPPGVYVLVVGRMPRYEVIGWAHWPQDQPAAQSTTLGHPERPPCWAIPQSSLRPLSDLPRSS
jgi:hypothetical protein